MYRVNHSVMQGGYVRAYIAYADKDGGYMTHWRPLEWIK
jgi:hypothetical protein